MKKKILIKNILKENFKLKLIFFLLKMIVIILFLNDHNQTKYIYTFDNNNLFLTFSLFIFQKRSLTKIYYRQKFERLHNLKQKQKKINTKISIFR